MAITRLGLIAVPRFPYGAFSGKTETEVERGAGWPTRLVKLPDGRKEYLNARQIEELRIRLSRQKPSKRQAKRIKKEKPKAPEIEIAEELPLLLPRFYSFIPPEQQADRIRAEIAEILAINEENDILILLMVA